MGTIFKGIWKWIVSGSVFASILGIALYFMASNTAIIISLTFVCLLLLVITCYILYALHVFIRQSHTREYDIISSFAEFRSDNGVKSSYDTHRVIQCKRMALSEIKYNFKWSGSKLPTVSSTCQNIKEIHSTTPEEWDYAILELKNPLIYNECTVLHFHTENDDSDGKAGPFLSLKVETPISFIQFRALLSYKSDEYKRTAIFERRRFDSNVDAGWETIQSVPFDSEYKSYTCMQERPVPGYSYRLRWEK